MRIPGGAAYRFAKIPGIAAASTADPFYNARLQMADIGDDMLVLFAHPGGDFTLRLQPQPPLAWLAGDLLADSLDHTLIYLPGTGGDWLALIFALIPGFWLAWSARRRHLPSRAIWTALLAEALFAGLHALYAVARAGEVTITSKPVQISYLGFAGTFLLVSLGAALIIQSRSRRVKLLSLMVAAFPALAPSLFSLAVMVLFNMVYARPALGTGIYNYALAQMALIAFIFETLLFGLVFYFFKLRIDR